MIFAGVSLIVAGVMDLCAIGITKDFKVKSEENIIDLDDEDIQEIKEEEEKGEE